MRKYIFPIIIVLWALLGSWYWVTFQKSEEACCDTPAPPYPVKCDTVYIRDTIRIIEIVYTPKTIYKDIYTGKIDSTEFLFKDGMDDFDTTTIKGNKVVWNNILKLLESHNGDITIVGHTNEIGDSLYNMDLSMRRAQSMKRKIEELKLGNIKNIRIVIKAMGESEQKYKGAEGIIKNRRVHIILEKK